MSAAPMPSCCGAPASHRLAHLLNNLLRPLGSESVKPGGIQHGLQVRAVVRVVDVQHMVGFVDVGVEVKGRCQPPAVGAQNEAVVAQMVVPVAHGHVKGS